MKVKICGVTDLDTALWAVECGADALGFVFAESKRQISAEQAKNILQHIPSHIMTVGVFVDEELSIIQELTSFCGFQMVQLHGDESVEAILSCKLPVIKAFGVGTLTDLKAAATCPSDYILLDSPKGKYRGGNGTSFDWNFATNLPLEQKQKTILAGGLTNENVTTAIQSVRPFMVDVSSGVETNGKKDFTKIKEFIMTAKKGVTQQ